MHDLTAKRTLVKSPPELWSELSEVDRLARHLDAFGEIKITKLEPEHTVAWEGETASGTVSIEPSGWGTKVTLTAQLEGAAGAAAAPEPEAPAEEPPPIEAPTLDTAAEDAEPEPVEAPATEESALVETAAPADAAEEPADDAAWDEPAAPEPDEPVQAARRKRRGFLAWLFRTRTSAQATRPEPVGGEAEPAGGEAEPTLIAPEPLDRGPESVDSEPEPAGGEAEQAGGEAEPAGGDLDLGDGVDPGDGPTEPAALDAAELEPLGAPPGAHGEEPVVADGEPVAAAVAEDAGESEDAPGVPEPVDGQPKLDPEHAQAVLDEVLDTLGSAHHRPFSRG
jgi:hypothetical protein